MSLLALSVHNGTGRNGNLNVIYDSRRGVDPFFGWGEGGKTKEIFWRTLRAKSKYKSLCAKFKIVYV